MIGSYGVLYKTVNILISLLGFKSFCISFKLMKNLIILMALITSSPGIIFNFGTQNNTETWRIVNDGVMGGLSTSSITENKNTVLFKGETSLENNGGFASIRTLIEKGSLKNCKTMTIRFKSSSTDRTFGLSLKTSQRYYVPYHKFTFKPKSGDWEVLKVNISEFKHYRISDIIGDTMPLDVLPEVFNIALIVSDSKAGAFDIEIDYIKFE